MELQMTEDEKREALQIAHENVIGCIRRFGINDDRTTLARRACQMVEKAILDAPCLANTLAANHLLRALDEAVNA